MKWFLEKALMFIMGRLSPDCKTPKPVTHIDRVIIYERFARGGNTDDIKYYFKHASTLVDTMAGRQTKLDEQNHWYALKKIKSKTHFQQKIAGITLAGKFFEGDTEHHFIYLKEQKGIIDLTDMRTYLLKDSLPFTPIASENK
jgi:hypothetical protein